MFKKINIKSMIVGIVIGIVLCSSVFADISSIQVLFNDIKVSLDGVVLDMKDAKGNTVQPLVYNGTTYLPARALCEALGKDIKMNEITNVLEITTRKEDVALMSENVGTVTPVYKVTYRKDSENSRIIISTQNGVDYVGINDVEAFFLSKFNDNYNNYFFKYDEVTNTSYIEHNYREKITKDTPININIERKTDKLLENIPSFKVETSMILIKYDYYLNNILPLFNQESSN